MYYFVFLGCKKDNTNILNEGNWLVELSVLDNQKLPFNLMLEKSIDGTYEGKVYNADEIIVVDEINVYGDSILMQMPVFEGYLKGEFSKDFIKGDFIKESLNRIVPIYSNPRNRKKIYLKQNSIGVNFRCLGNKLSVLELQRNI